MHPVLEKHHVTETTTEEINTPGCDGLSESLLDTSMNDNGESRKVATDRKMEVLSTKSKI